MVKRKHQSESLARNKAREVKGPGPCEICGARESEVHHKDRNPFNYDLSNLERLCEPCHKLRHVHAPDRLRILRIIRVPLIDSLRQHEITAAEFDVLCRHVRRKLGLSMPGRAEALKGQLPKLLTQDALKSLFEAIDKGGDTKHQVMCRLLLYTGIRVSELCSIKLSDVDLQSLKIRITYGKGGKDRNVPIPATFRLALRAYMGWIRPGSVYLFESNRRTHFSTGMIRAILADYSHDAGLPRVHPHMLRHQCLTALCAQGLTDAQVQVISGHSSRDNLAIYQHLSLGEVQSDYQDAVKSIGI